MFKVIELGRKVLGFKNQNGMVLEVRAMLTGLLVIEESMQQQVM